MARTSKKGSPAKEKLYVLRQYIRARDIPSAMKKGRSLPYDDVWVDDAWKAGNAKGLADAVGFRQLDGTRSQEDD